jgi:hypothetical protein
MASFGAFGHPRQPLVDHGLCPNDLYSRMKLLNAFGCIQALELDYLSEAACRPMGRIYLR